MRKHKPNEKAKLRNQSLVFEAFAEDEKLTIPEVTLRVNTKLEEFERISEQTVRRAVSDLVQSGLLKPFGRNYNAQTYGKLSASFSDPKDQNLVPYAGEMVTIESFVRTMTDPEVRPLKLKTNLFAEKSQHTIRRMMLFAIISAGEPGYNESLKGTAENLFKVIEELEFALAIIKTFVDSPVWYEQYRDRIGRAVRKLVEDDPELYKLALDYMRSEK